MSESKYATVAELLEDPLRWCKGAEAIDINGARCDAGGSDAVSWCLTGACWRVYGLSACHAFNALDRIVLGDLGYMSVVGFNDSPKTTHADVLALVKKAGI